MFRLQRGVEMNRFAPVKQRKSCGRTAIVETCRAVTLPAVPGSLELRRPKLHRQSLGVLVAVVVQREVNLQLLVLVELHRVHPRCRDQIFRGDVGGRNEARTIRDLRPRDQRPNPRPGDPEDRDERRHQPNRQCRPADHEILPRLRTARCLRTFRVNQLGRNRRRRHGVILHGEDVIVAELHL